MALTPTLRFTIEVESYSKCPPDGMTYWDSEGYSASFETGPQFGCVHWEPKL